MINRKEIIVKDYLSEEVIRLHIIKLLVEKLFAKLELRLWISISYLVEVCYTNKNMLKWVI